MIYDLRFVFLGCKDKENQWGGEKKMGNKLEPCSESGLQFD